MNKNELRQQILASRNEMPSAERMSKHKAVFQNLLSIPKVQEARTIMLYLDFRGEVETDNIFQWGWQAGKCMAVPVTIQTERKLIPVEIHSFEELQLGAYGIREPKGSAGTQPTKESVPKGLPVTSLDVVIVPGVAFDRQGGRLGYGGGYYDRFLPMLRSDTLKIGLAYELQLVDKVPVEEHDIHLDLLVTEESVRHCKAST